MRGAKERAQQAVAAQQQGLQRRAEELERELTQLRPAALRQSELAARLADREERLKKLQKEVRWRLQQACIALSKEDPSPFANCTQ